MRAENHACLHKAMEFIHISLNGKGLCQTKILTVGGTFGSLTRIPNLPWPAQSIGLVSFAGLDPNEKLISHNEKCDNPGHKMYLESTDLKN
jgi:hypothetical protein